MTLKPYLTKLVDAAKRVYASAPARTIVGAAVSGACAFIGLHVSPDHVIAIMTVGAALAGMGPHNPDV